MKGRILPFWGEFSDDMIGEFNIFFKFFFATQHGILKKNKKVLGGLGMGHISIVCVLE